MSSDVTTILVFILFLFHTDTHTHTHTQTHIITQVDRSDGKDFKQKRMKNLTRAQFYCVCKAPAVLPVPLHLRVHRGRVGNPMRTNVRMLATEIVFPPSSKVETRSGEDSRKSVQYFRLDSFKTKSPKFNVFLRFARVLI